MANIKLNSSNDMIEDLIFIRRILDLSQQELGDILNISRSTVAKNETCNLTIDYMIRFSSMLDTLLRDESYKSRLNDVQRFAITRTLNKVYSFQHKKLNLEKMALLI